MVDVLVEVAGVVVVEVVVEVLAAVELELGLKGFDALSRSSG